MSSPTSTSAPWALGGVVAITVVAAVVLGHVFSGGRAGDGGEVPAVRSASAVDAAMAMEPVAPALPSPASPAPVVVAPRVVTVAPAPVVAPPATLDTGSGESDPATTIAQGIAGAHHLREDLEAVEARLRDAGATPEVLQIAMRAQRMVLGSHRIQQLSGGDPAWSQRIEEYRQARDHIASPGELPSLRTRMFPADDLARLAAWEEVDGLLRSPPRDS